MRNAGSLFGRERLPWGAFQWRDQLSNDRESLTRDGRFVNTVDGVSNYRG